MTTTHKWQRQYTAQNPRLKPVYFEALWRITGLTQTALAAKLGRSAATVGSCFKRGGSLQLLSDYSLAAGVDLEKVLRLGRKMEIALAEAGVEK